MTNHQKHLITEAIKVQGASSRMFLLGVQATAAANPTAQETTSTTVSIRS